MEPPGPDDPSFVTALAIAVVRLLAPQPSPAVSFSLTHVEDAKPQFIYVYNLDAGPLKIQLMRAQEDDDPSGPIRILNELSEGVKEIAQPLR